MRVGQSLQAGTTSARSLGCAVSQLPPALPRGHPVGFLFFSPSLGSIRTGPADLRVTGQCGGKWTAVAIGGVWGWRPVRKLAIFSCPDVGRAAPPRSTVLEKEKKEKRKRKRKKKKKKEKEKRKRKKGKKRKRKEKRKKGYIIIHYYSLDNTNGRQPWGGRTYRSW